MAVNRNEREAIIMEEHLIAFMARAGVQSTTVLQHVLAYLRVKQGDRVFKPHQYALIEAAAQLLEFEIEAQQVNDEVPF